MGLPSYLDDYCLERYECILPLVDFAGNNNYQDFGGTVDGGIWVTNYQGQSNVTHVRGAHTLRGGVDLRWAQRTSLDGAGNMGSFAFDNTYTRAADTTNVFPAQQLGLSLAALMLGIPTSVSIEDNNGFDVRNRWFGTFAQDTWRVNANLTINFGLRFEYEIGIKEKKTTGWCCGSIRMPRCRSRPGPKPRTRAIRCRSCRPASSRSRAVRSTPALPGMTIGPGNPRRSGCRVSRSATSWARRTSSRAATASTTTRSTPGTSRPTRKATTSATTNPVSTDFGQTWLLGDPKNGILPLVDPFPVRSGSRYQVPVGSSLGADTILAPGGNGFTAENPDRVHSRVQRWRLGWQRDLGSRTVLDIAYAGSYADRQGIAIRQDYLPEQYWSGANVRDTSANDFLTANVTNPFNIANFASLQTSNPALYARLAANAFFTSSTIPRHRLLRPFPHMSNSNNGLRYNDQPLGEIKSHSLELVVTRRYSDGLTANGALTVNRVTENRTVEEYDREPTLWQTNNNGRPWRLTGTAVYELPFGPGKPLLRDAACSPTSPAAGRWAARPSTSRARCSTGNNLFFSGNLNDIRKNKPEIALRPDGTFDPTKTWFNIDAGFERDTADQPAGFQKRAFPFRVDGVRGFDLAYVHANVARTFTLGGRRTFQFRLDIQNLLNRQHYANPNMDPTSTNFGQIRDVNNSVMRFFTFNTKFSF